MPDGDSKPMLVILSGLPGTGKTTIARQVAREIGAVYLRVDTIEVALQQVHGQEPPIVDQGYRVAYAIAEDNLRLRQSVVADSVNPIAVTRTAWHAVAERAGVAHLNVEVICSDRPEHRRRVETRDSDLADFTPPTWQQVIEREYEDWEADRVVIDTAKLTPGQCAATIRAVLNH